MNEAIEGGCVCGGLRYRLKEEPKDRNDCHCIDCRRSSGAPFYMGHGCSQSVGAYPGVIAHDSACRAHSFLRGCCGTHLFFADQPESETIDVTIASLDDPTPFAPQMSIWTEDRLPWVLLDQSRPVYRKSRRHG